MNDALLAQAREAMDKAIENFQKQLARIRTGRANLSILEPVRVDYYGQLVPLQQVASMAIPEPRLITITPWETKLIPEIERAIDKANLGLSASSDGKLVRLPIPALTEERRKDLAKSAKSVAEEARVGVRQARRDAMEAIKKLEKDKQLSEDDAKKTQDLVQKATDAKIAEVDSLLAHKEKEIMTI